jgi:hypothetical protein
MKKILLTVMIAVLAVPAMTSFAAGNPAAKKQNLASLVRNAREALALAAQGFKESKVDPKAKAVTPFARSLKAATKSVKTAEAQVKSKDKALTKTLSEAARQVRTLEVTFSRSGIKNEKAEKGVKAANESILIATKDVLGGGLEKAGSDKAAAEKGNTQYAKLQQQQKVMAEKFSKLQEQVKKDKNADPVFAKTVAHLYNESQKLSNTPYSSNSLADALLLVADLAGLFDGWTYYVDPAYTTYWTPLVSSIDSSQSWTVELWEVVPYDVSYYEMEFDMPADYDLVELSEADMLAFEEYSEVSYEGTDLEVDADDISDFSADDVAATDDADYLEEDVIEEEVGDLDDADDADQDDGGDADDKDDGNDDDDHGGDDDAGDDDGGDDDAGDDGAGGSDDGGSDEE